MEKVKVLVVEDEVVIAHSIISMIEKMGFECVGTAIRATKGLEIAKEKKPDIALLDINLKGEETGIWLAKEIKKILDIPFIFLTSFGDKKTIEEAASTIPYGYILKPVEQQNIFAAITTALAKFSSEQKIKDDSGTSEEDSKEEEQNRNDAMIIKDALFIKDEYQYVKINLEEIDFIKSDGNYVELHGDGRKKVIKETLKKIEAKLTENIFFQVHRSYVVNIRKIESIGGAHIIVNGSEIPIVKQRKDALLSLLNTLS